MEFGIIIIFLICIIVILRILFGSSKKQIEEIAKNETLDELAEKYPSNVEMCKEYLKMFENINKETKEVFDLAYKLGYYTLEKESNTKIKASIKTLNQELESLETK